ncbi:MAG: hypothetical protein RLZZ599_629 [Bacteroidota bacterium]|jgi:hypothetical protein
MMNDENTPQEEPLFPAHWSEAAKEMQCFLDRIGAKDKTRERMGKASMHIKRGVK